MSSVEIKNQAQTFFLKEKSRLLLFVRKRVGTSFDIADAEDIISDVAFNLFNKVDFDKPIENLVAYIYRSLSNKISDYYRNEKKEIPFTGFEIRNGKTKLDTVKIEDLDESDLYEYEKNYSLQLEILYDALEELTEEEKNLIIATELQGKSFKEISLQTAIPVGTLLSKKHRAMGKVQKIAKNKYKQQLI